MANVAPPNPLGVAQEITTHLASISTTLDQNKGFDRAALQEQHTRLDQCIERSLSLYPFPQGDRAKLCDLMMQIGIQSSVLLERIATALKKTPIKKEEPNPLADEFRLVYRSPAITIPNSLNFFLLGAVHNDAVCAKLIAAFIEQHCATDAILLCENHPFAAGPVKDKAELEVILRHHQITPNKTTKWTILGWDSATCHQIYEKLENMNKKIRETTAETEQHDLANKRNTLLAATLPERTESMVNAINAVAKQLSEGTLKGKVFVIAGVYHLQTHPAFKDDPRFSLAKLIAALDSLKSVILRPKSTDIAY